jgi:hypothetical protein
MAKIDRIKETIGYLKVVFGILVAVDVSLLAWLSQSSLDRIDIRAMLAFLAAIFVTLSIIWVNRKILQRIDDLEAL